MTMHYATSWLIGMLVGLPTQVVAQPIEVPHPVKARLACEKTGIVPGEPVLIGIVFEIEPKWHIYWDGVNDTGVPPRIVWTAPEGVKIGPVQWPAPSRHVIPGGLLDHVYEGRVTLLAPVTLDADASATIEIGVDVMWTVCDEICLIDRAKLDITLPVVEAKSARPSADAKAFAEAKARLPKENEGAIELAWEGTSLTLTAPNAVEMSYFARRGKATPANLVEEGHAKGSKLTLRFEGAGGIQGVVEATMPDGSHVIRHVSTTMPE
jgi:DsbC/DsbD-like thiol-disulfide interchange protein